MEFFFQELLALGVFHVPSKVGYGDFLALFDVAERVDSDAPYFFVPCVLCVASAGMIDARCVEEETALTGLGAKRENVRLGDAEEWAVIALVGIVKTEEGAMVITGEILQLFNNMLIQELDGAVVAGDCEEGCLRKYACSFGDFGNGD